MDTLVQEVEDWESRSFSGGYDGLRTLADSSFSGVVSAAGTWAIFVNGRIVSVVERSSAAADGDFEDGSIDSFENADGTVRRAPHPGVALLIAMQLSEGETRGQYYTEDTPIADVDETLSEGGFTGYLELSENVLSGDYYTVYQAGRSTDVAFVGNARRLQTDAEARESARNEVGIYKVVAVDIDVTEIPEPEEPEESTAGAGGGVVAGSSPAGEDDSPVTAQETDSAPETDPEPEATVEEADDRLERVPGETETEEVSTDVGNSSPSSDEISESASSTGDEVTATSPTEPEADVSEPTRSADTSSDAEPEERNTTPEATGGAMAASSPATEDGKETATERLASRSIPSLDPERTGTNGSTNAGGRRDRPGGRNGTTVTDSEPGHTTTEGTADLRADLQEARNALEAAEAEREAAKEELADVRATLEEVRAERDDLREEVERLRDRLTDLETAGSGTGASSTAGPSLSPAEAVAGTDLFVRYDSKGATTVADACEGNGSPDDLRANLDLDYHTRFEAKEATVDGKPFADWLHESQRFRFATWVVSQLVFEIRDTGSVDGMRALYEALPAVDRIELDGSVAIQEDGSELELGFDLVFRDRMGEPLFIADLDDARDPVSESAMAELVQDGLAVCEAEETFAAAFYVTAAFYEPAALETASDATSGSLLSRDSRKSFVKQSRKRGFHLALVEARDENGFSLSVPDL